MENNLQILKEELEQAYNLHKSADTRDLLYHYTNYNGLKGILEQKKLRYTNYKYFCDRIEIQGLITLIKKILLSQIPTICRDYPYLFESFSGFNDHYALYIACFSKAMNPLLWRYAANNGTGFAIGFNKEFYSTPENNNASNKPFIHYTKAEVQYDVEVKKIIGTLLAIFEKFYHKANSQTERGKGLPYLIASLVRLLPLFKEKSFKHEQEIRFFCCESELLPDPITGEPPYFFDNADKDFISTDLFVESQGQLGKPVILQPFLPSAISEIWIGYQCEYLEASTAIKKLLHEHGFRANKIRIEKAPAPSKPKDIDGLTFLCGSF